MADTYPKLPLKVNLSQNSLLSYAARELEEAASQTFVQDAPVVVTSGLVNGCANNPTSIAGFALKAGQNAASAAALSKFVPAYPGIEFFANLLDNTDPVNNDHTFARADVFNDFEIEVAAVLADGSSAWFVSDDTTSGECRPVDTRSDFTHTEASGTGGRDRPAVGDLNPRLTFALGAAICQGTAAP